MGLALRRTMRRRPHHIHLRLRHSSCNLDWPCTIPDGMADGSSGGSPPGPPVRHITFMEDVAPADIVGTWGDNHGSLPGDATPQLDSSVKCSGVSSLKFTIPSNSNANSSGSHSTNFSDDLSAQFGGVRRFPWEARRQIRVLLLFP